MAVLKFENGNITVNLNQIQEVFTPHGISLNKWDIDKQAAHSGNPYCVGVSVRVEVSVWSPQVAGDPRRVRMGIHRARDSAAYVDVEQR